MCPACVTSFTTLLAGALSAGGLVAFVATAFGGRPRTAGVRPGRHRAGTQIGAHHGRSSNRDP